MYWDCNCGLGSHRSGFGPCPFAATSIPFPPSSTPRSTVFNEIDEDVRELDARGEFSVTSSGTTNFEKSIETFGVASGVEDVDVTCSSYRMFSSLGSFPLEEE